jgi:hypothetical protein
MERIPFKIRTKHIYWPFLSGVKKNSLGFDISEVAFVNWSAGEQASISTT